jgi:hypothetical protein
MSLTPAPFVAIYELTREWTTYRWLCETCLTAIKAEGWTARYRVQVDQACDRCPRVPSQFAKPDGSVAYLPTTRAARLPTRAECPPPRVLPPWPKPKARPPQRKAAPTDNYVDLPTEHPRVQSGPVGR